MAREAERLFIALFIDENVDERLGPVLRRYGYEALTAKEAKRKGQGDEEQLEYAVQGGMALISHNIADFARLHQQWQEQGREHYGIILARTTNFKGLLRKALRLLDSFTAEEAMNKIIFI